MTCLFGVINANNPKTGFTIHYAKSEKGPLDLADELLKLIHDNRPHGDKYIHGVFGLVILGTSYSGMVHSLDDYARAEWPQIQDRFLYTNKSKLMYKSGDLVPVILYGM